MPVVARDSGATGADPLFKLSYDPLKVRLLFHEKTTLDLVLEDAVSKVRAQLADYFAAKSSEKSTEDTTEVEVCSS